MKVIKLIYILVVFFSAQLEAQSIILDLLYGQSVSVFQAKVERIRYISSNAQGSSFGLTVKVKKFYKGDNHPEKVGFSVDKIDVIDLELDTMILDYSFQITQDSSYIFFTDEIVYAKNDSIRKSGLTKFTEYNIEGIPFTKELERQIEGYDSNTSVTVKNKYYPVPNYAFSLMRTNSKSIFLGKVSEITEMRSKVYKLKVSTKNGNKFVISKNINCICQEGSIKIGHEYLFYTNKDETNKFRLVDEWLGVIQASEYDKVKYNK